MTCYGLQAGDSLQEEGKKKHAQYAFLLHAFRKQSLLAGLGGQLEIADERQMIREGDLRERKSRELDVRRKADKV